MIKWINEGKPTNLLYQTFQTSYRDIWSSRRWSGISKSSCVPCHKEYGTWGKSNHTRQPWVTSVNPWTNVHQESHCWWSILWDGVMRRVHYVLSLPPPNHWKTLKSIPTRNVPLYCWLILKTQAHPRLGKQESSPSGRPRRCIASEL